VTDRSRCSRIIRLKELIELIGLSRSTIYDRSNPKSKRYDPLFPKPLKLGSSAIGWLLDDVLAWIGSLKK
jgi:prophage regulatory protein